MAKTLRKLIKFVFIMGLVVGLIWLIHQYGVETIRENVKYMGIWAPVGIFALRFISVVIPALPSTAWSLLAGGVLGNFWIALITVVLADVVACSLGFYLAKRFGRNLVEKLVGTRFMDKVDKVSQRHLESNFFLLVGFLMTGLFDFVSYGAGLTTTKWVQFVPALLIGVLISNTPVVAIGANMFADGYARWLIVLAILGIFSLAILTGWLQRRNNDTARG
ncbi:VTT domain-containing protein [Acaryochloris sp. IP29b_bin.137]|uniref:TVP38/TMEM64 family protein n=1 Tax=Acaryochloris sp. IP29b_bin.137 TaxID=2969217 RepID=UPI002602FD21|nr:VTT domain-containing protein [Acaryochloris sp. IP29b_bin.137]